MLLHTHFFVSYLFILFSFLFLSSSKNQSFNLFVSSLNFSFEFAADFKNCKKGSWKCNERQVGCCFVLNLIGLFFFSLITELPYVHLSQMGFSYDWYSLVLKYCSRPCFRRFCSIEQQELYAIEKRQKGCFFSRLCCKICTNIIPYFTACWERIWKPRKSLFKNFERQEDSSWFRSSKW